MAGVKDPIEATLFGAFSAVRKERIMDPDTIEEAARAVALDIWAVLRRDFAELAPPALVARIAVWRFLHGDDDDIPDWYAALGDTQEPRPDVERLERALSKVEGLDPEWGEDERLYLAVQIAREYAAASPAAPKENDHE